MADKSGGNGGLYFIVGALVAILGVAMTGHMPLIGSKHVDVKIEAPAPASK